MHMASVSSRRGPSKYKEGQEVTGRILEVEAAKKHVSMSLKKLLCNDKLPTISSSQVSRLARAALTDSNLPHFMHGIQVLWHVVHKAVTLLMHSTWFVPQSLSHWLAHPARCVAQGRSALILSLR